MRMMPDFRSSLDLLTYHTTSEMQACLLSLGSVAENIRARLQYEISQQPRLLERLSTPLLELLQTTLDSHRLALTINQDNADLLLYAVVRNQCRQG